MQNSFIKNFSITGISNILIIIITMTNNIIVTRWIGPEGRGIYALVSNTVLFLNLFFGEGIRRSNTILIGKSQSNIYKLLIINIVYFFIIGFCFSAIFFFESFFKYFIPNISSPFFLLALMISIFSILWQSLQAVYLGLQRIVYFNIIIVSSVSTILILNTIGIYFLQFSVFEILRNILVSNIIISIVGFIGFWKTKRHVLKSNIKIFQQLKLSLRSTLSSIDVFIINKSGIFFVNKFLGTLETGLYSIAIIFSDLIQKIPNVAGTLLFSKTANEKDQNIFHNIARVSRTVIFINFSISVFLILFGDFVITILFGDEFINAYLPLSVMSLGFTIGSAALVIQSYFMGIGYPKILIQINTFFGLTALFTNYFLIGYLSLLGAGISYTAIFSLWGISYVILFKRKSNLSFSEILIIRQEDIMEISSFVSQKILKKNKF